MISRRKFLLGGLAGGTALAAGFWPDDGLINQCGVSTLPAASAAVVEAAWAGLDAEQVWDCHVHLIGVGDDASGIWMNPAMDSLAHPIQTAQKRFYLNASCVTDDGHVDSQYVARLLDYMTSFRAGSKLMLLAFDYFHDEAGVRRPELSSFHTPNRYAASVAMARPERFHWIASVHPYRKDAVMALEQAVAAGARAVKWLPPAMGMDPASPRCDAFYAAMARHDLPLLTHAGHEQAVHGGDTQDYGNPLRLRRALDHGVRVIVAHCASLGDGVDLDRGPDGPKVENFDLFARLMDEKRYEGRLFGDISAITQFNRLGKPLETVLRRDDWHPRLLNGSDFPLPGVMPLFSAKLMAERGYLDPALAAPIAAIRPHNPLLFDFVLKRHLALDGKRFDNLVFETARAFPAAVTMTKRETRS